MLYGLNCCSLLNKTLEIEAHLKCLDVVLDVLVVTEHWFGADYLGFLGLDGFVVGSAFGRKKSLHGGVGILMGGGCIGRPLVGIEALSLESHCEVAAVLIDDMRVVVVGVYRPPAGDFARFLETMNGILSRLHGRDRVIVAGDFNVYFDDLTDGRTGEFRALLLSYGFRWVFVEPTRGNRCLDNVLVNFGVDGCVMDTIDNELSDHSGQLFGMPRVGSAGMVLVRHFRSLSPDDIWRVGDLLCGCDWTFILDENRSVDVRWSGFISLFLRCVNVVAPMRTKRVIEGRDDRIGVWYTPELGCLARCLRIFNRSLRVFRSDVLLRCRNRLRAVYRRGLRAARREAFDQAIQCSGNKSRTLWKLVNARRGVVGDRGVDIGPDVFNDFFLGVSDSLVLGTGASLHDPLAFSVPVIGEEFSFSTVDIPDVMKIVGALSRSSAMDCFGLSVGLVRDCLLPVLPQLTNLINLVLLSGVFPSCLKLAVVIPIYKKGCRAQPGNFRPISLLPVFSKIIEKIMSSQLADFLDRYELISPSQFGFRRGKNTQDAVLSLVQGAVRAFENSRYYSSTFYDLSRAFDSVNHRLLLRKLERYGLHASALGLLASYLDNRMQYVDINGARSRIRRVAVGVPQGSVLGPLLFLLFINDLPQQIGGGVDCHLYADDTTVSFVESDLAAIKGREETVRGVVTDWFTSHSLGINLNKTCTMTMSLRDLGGIVDPGYVKFLGIVLDPGLDFRGHVEMLSLRINRQIFLLRRMANLVSSGSLLNVYYGLVHSQMQYGILVWGHTPLAMERIFRLQRRAIRIVFSLGYSTDCRESFVASGIMTFPSIFIFRAILHLHGGSFGYDTGASTHGYDTRGKSLLRLPPTRLCRTRNSVNYWSVVLYNCLPQGADGWGTARLRRRLGDYLRTGAFYSLRDFISSDFSTF